MRIKYLFLIIALLLAISCNDQKNQLDKENIYSTNLTTFIETSWNNKDFSSFNKTIDTKYIRVLNNVRIASNPNELRANMQVFQTGFPDLFIEINELTFKNNRAFLAWTFIGTNIGIFGENPATGKKVKVHGFSVIEFSKEGKILKEEIHYNELDFLQQLGYTLILPNVE